MPKRERRQPTRRELAAARHNGGDDRKALLRPFPTQKESSMSEEPRYEDVLHALRVRLAGNPRVRDLPADDLSHDLLYNGGLSTKPDPALVRRALKEIGRDQGEAT